VLPAVVLLGAGASALRQGERGFGLVLAVVGLAVSLARGSKERRIDLRDLRNAAEVRQALLAAQARLAPGSPRG